MTKIVKCAMLLLTCTGALARPLPDAPQRVNAGYTSSRITTRDIVFVSAGFGAAAADAWTTQHNLARGCYEMNPIVGANPSAGKLWGVVLGVTAGQELVAWEFKRHGHARIAGIVAGGVVVGHSFAAIHNAAQSCR